MSRAYGGYEWSNNEAIDDRSYAPAGLLAGAIAAGAYAGIRTLSSGNRPVDFLSAAVSHAGNLSWFQLGHTFRGPELLSPFVSQNYRLATAGQNTQLSPTGYTWNANQLNSDAAYDWVKYSTGLSEAELSNRGFHRGGLAAENGLRWQANGLRGSLYSVTSQGEYLLSDRIGLLQSGTPTGRLNRVGQAMIAASGIYDEPGIDASDFNRKLFSEQTTINGKTSYTTASHMPIPLGGGINQSTLYPRGVLAFQVDRFNQLLKNVGGQFFGEAGQEFLSSAVGFDTSVRPGSASSLMFRYGSKAAMVGAAYAGMRQLDWTRREYGLPGQILASTVISAGVGYAAHVASFKPHNIKMAAVGSFFGQMILPGFREGVPEGIATNFANLDVLRAGSLNPFGYLRGGLENIAPGITSWQTGALLGVAGILGAGLSIPGINRLPTRLAERFNIGVSSHNVEATIRSTRDVFYQTMSTRHNIDYNNILNRPGMFFRENAANNDALNSLNQLNRIWSDSEAAIRERPNLVNNVLSNRLLNRPTPTDMFDQVSMNLRGHAEAAFYSFFGADTTEMSTQTLNALRAKGYRGFGKLGRLATIGSAILAGHQFMTGGLLGSTQTSQEVSDIYHGKELIEVKRGRWWEAGGSPFSGYDTHYFRPHAIHTFLNRSREKAIWGDNEDRISPFGKWWRKNFTYELEEQHYYDRPYPISDIPFSNIPVIGQLLGNTIGRLIKPPRLMHAGEWTDGENFAHVYKGDRAEPAYDLGALGPGVPTSPYAGSEQLAFMSYQGRELEGLTGWAKNVIQKTLTGSELYGTAGPILANAGEMSSAREAFWDANLGGMLFSNEFIRRLLPPTPAEKQGYNPIVNRMPDWIPDRFHYGDPYALIESGNVRLPGSGYASVNPDVKNLDPADYSLFHRYKILSDIAPSSKEYSLTKETVYQARMRGEFTQAQELEIDRIDQRQAKQLAGLSFPKLGLTARLYDFMGSILRHVAAPVEYLLPMGFRPIQKLLPPMNPIEAYESDRLYGTHGAFWDRPIRDWFRPSFYSTLHLFGFDGKPGFKREVENVDTYFDKLEFVKQMKLSREASQAGDKKAAFEAKWKAARTRHGVNPQGSPLSIYWSLPDEDRKYFNSFSLAQGRDRKRILEMVPEDQAHLYNALWSRLDSGEDPSLTKGVVDEEHLQQQLVAAEGYFADKPAPPPDWIGFHSEVDLDDIKVRYVENLGRDIHDFGLWQSDVVKSHRQPFLSDAADFLTDGIPERTSMLHNLLGNGSWVSATNGIGTGGVMHFKDRRDADIERAYRRAND